MVVTDHLDKIKLLKRIRFWIIVFALCLVLSGISAFTINAELSFAFSHQSWFPEFFHAWISKVYFAVSATKDQYPFLFYGTDWLAFGHIVIAIAFIGLWIDPVRNIWIFRFGMIACGLVIPLALIAGQVRNIPFYWRLFDCAFGVFGFIPLYIAFRMTKRLEGLELAEK